MYITVKLNSGQGASLGPNFTLTTNVGIVTPGAASLDQLLLGVSCLVSDSASIIYVTSQGACTDTLTLNIPVPPTTTVAPTTLPPTTTLPPLDFGIDVACGDISNPSVGYTILHNLTYVNKGVAPFYASITLFNTQGEAEANTTWQFGPESQQSWTVGTFVYKSTYNNTTKWLVVKDANGVLAKSVTFDCPVVVPCKTYQINNNTGITVYWNAKLCDGTTTSGSVPQNSVSQLGCLQEGTVSSSGGTLTVLSTCGQ